LDDADHPVCICIRLPLQSSNSLVEAAGAVTAQLDTATTRCSQRSLRALGNEITLLLGEGTVDV